MARVAISGRMKVSRRGGGRGGMGSFGSNEIAYAPLILAGTPVGSPDTTSIDLTWGLPPGVDPAPYLLGSIRVLRSTDLVNWIDISGLVAFTGSVTDPDFSLIRTNYYKARFENISTGPWSDVVAVAVSDGSIGRPTLPLPSIASARVNKNKILVLYNTDVAWSEDSADHWITTHGITSHKMGFPAIAGVPGNGYHAWNVTGSRSWLYDRVLEISAYCVANGIEGIVTAGGFPLLVILPRYGAPTEFDTVNLNSFLSGIPQYIARGEVPFAGSLENGFPRWSDGAECLFDARSRTGNALSPKRYLPPGFTPTNATPFLSSPYNGAGEVPVIPATGFYYHGRIGAPKFNNDANIPDETLAATNALVTRAKANERTLAQQITDQRPIHVGIYDRIAGEYGMTRDSMAATYDWLNALGLNLKDVRLVGGSDATSAFSEYCAPIAGWDYSRSRWLDGTDTLSPMFGFAGYSLLNDLGALSAATPMWNVDSGAFVWAGTSSSWIWVALAQKLGGIGGCGALFEPFASDQGDCSTWMLLMVQGFSMMEATYRTTNFVPWASTCYGDPLYSPFGA